MLVHLIQFHLHLMTYYLISGHYREELIVDDTHPHYRRFTVQYKKKRSMVKNFWIGAGLITLAFPLLHIAFILALLTTLISFCLLDETS